MKHLSEVEKFQQNIETLRKTSIDDSNGSIEYMTEINKKVISFDGVKQKYTQELHVSEEGLKSVDALFEDQNKIYFVEFKNGYVSKSVYADLKKKASDSLLIFNELMETQIRDTREKCIYIVVYNEEKNLDKSLPKSVSRDLIHSHMIDKAGEIPKRFELGKLEKLLFKSVETLNEREFNDYMTKNGLI